MKNNLTEMVFILDRSGSMANLVSDTVGGWSDIVAVSTGYGHTVGLRADGTVVAAGENQSGQCGVELWRNIALPGSDGDGGRN